uniref:Solute carrier family 25 member 35 n=1 Tax=Strigamia maritima TaxID=126957 RepID=T1ISE8_STRMM
MEFLFGGLAASGAVLFSNPAEVIKTRMQLQGELQKKGLYTKHYKNVFHAGYVIARTDGLAALQNGLSAALVYQMVMNGTRLGVYQTIVNLGYTNKTDGDVSGFKTIAASALAGCLSGFISSPLYLIKTHFQCQSKSQKIAVGYQHHHKSLISALQTIYKDSGFTGLWRGSTAALPRITLGSAAQLTSYSKAKEYITGLNLDCCPQGSILSEFASSMLSGLVITLLMTPLDVISTRIYNQGVDAKGNGLLYDGFFDCIFKIAKNEGFWGFYKGFGASYVRVGPHTVLTLMIWTHLRSLMPIEEES